MKIIVDADSCPVMNDIIVIAEQHGVRVLFVADYTHDLHSDSRFVDRKIVEQSPDAVDIYIINVAGNEDIVVTNDIGLAGMVLDRAAGVISATGRRYSRDSIEPLLEQRHRSRKLRRAGVRLKQRHRSYSPSDRERFQQTLDSLLHEILSSQHDHPPHA